MDDWWVHDIDVQMVSGLGSSGPVFATAKPIKAFVVKQDRMIINQDGREVLSGTTLYADKKYAYLFTPGSRVDCGNGTLAVISCSVYDAGGLDLPECIEVALT